MKSSYLESLYIIHYESKSCQVLYIGMTWKINMVTHILCKASYVASITWQLILLLGFKFQLCFLTLTLIQLVSKVALASYCLLPTSIIVSCHIQVKFVCVCMYLHGHVWVSPFVHGQARGQPWVSFLICHSFCFRHWLSLDWRLPSRPSWMVREPQENFCLQLLSMGLQTHGSAFLCNWTEVSYLSK